MSSISQFCCYMLISELLEPSIAKKNSTPLPKNPKIPAFGYYRVLIEKRGIFRITQWHFNGTSVYCYFELMCIIFALGKPEESRKYPETQLSLPGIFGKKFFSVTGILVLASLYCSTYSLKIWCKPVHRLTSHLGKKFTRLIQGKFTILQH